MGGVTGYFPHDYEDSYSGEKADLPKEKLLWGLRLITFQKYYNYISKI